MAHLNDDIIYEIVDQVATFNSKDRRAILLNLSLVCRAVCDTIRPILFAEVKWPHSDKYNEGSGLLFFPEILWTHFKYFHLHWPDHWPDASPPLWGTKPTGGGGEYLPKHLDKLEAALPRMANVHTFQMTCPFDPPLSLIHVLAGCSNIKDLRITDTPLYLALLSDVPKLFNVERLTFLPVGEATRVGEGPFERRYHDAKYYTMGYRKRYCNELQMRTGSSFSSRWYFFMLCNVETLTFLQLSGDYYSLGDFKNPRLCFPVLQTLVFTGPPPTIGTHHTMSLPDVINLMPKLRDLRVLLCKASALGPDSSAQPPFSMIEARKNLYGDSQDDPSPPTAYAQITSLAMSNVVHDMKEVLRYTTALERLAISAIIHHPRIPIALSRHQIDELLDELHAGGGSDHLKHFRIMSEDDLDVALVTKLGQICPALEVVELERCGCREGGDGDKQGNAYADVFSKYQHLKELRIGIRFSGCEQHEHDVDTRCKECLLNGRRRSAIHIAARVPTLRRIGLEYRARTSSHRYEDRWMDFDILRVADGRLRLVELTQTWYQFPEVWESLPLED